MKTSKSSDPDSFAKSVVNYGYDQQQAWYEDAVQELGLVSYPDFLFVVVSKEPPYNTVVMRLDRDAVERGRELNRQAIDLYAKCEETGVWPGHGDGVVTVSLPKWAYTQGFTDDADDDVSSVM